MFIKILTILMISYTMIRTRIRSMNKIHDIPEKGSLMTDSSSLKRLKLDGKLEFDNISNGAIDFGNRFHFLPCAILYPNSVSDISSTIKHVFKMGSSSLITIAAKGHSHSLEGQAQTRGGVVINMESLHVYNDRDRDHDHDHDHMMMFQTAGESPYVDVSGGELWINILNQSLKHGLAPRSWTDYLHLTVGGTLSNGGLSGQAFKHGPQINNVYQLEVVTGKGDVMMCSDEQNQELFNSVLGGLGQFGIITKARIALEPAHKMVKWIRVLYTDFVAFTHDQEYLISSHSTFDYIEGFVMINNTGLLNNWRHFFNPKDPLEASKFNSDGKVLYCLEVVKYFNPNNKEYLDQNVDEALSKLNFINSTRFESEIEYVDFLDRVHISEIKLKKEGLWDVPHPWMNLLVPKSKIHEFSQQVFNNILTSTSNGPIIIYPVDQSTWRKSTSMITPDEKVFYLVAFLSSAMPNSNGTNGLDYILNKNTKILDFCKKKNLGVKQYLPYYTTQEEWKSHFGDKWDVLNTRKLMYDPLAILAPGQRIFEKGVGF